jgi:transcriptional repressor NrdR
MVCIHCGGQTSVVNSRAQRRVNQVWRRRQCDSCHTLFTTHEAADYSATWLVRGPAGQLTPFSRDKLFLSLHRSLGHRKHAQNDATALTETITGKLIGQVHDGLVEGAKIAAAVQVALNRFDKAASVHYSAFHRG